MITYYVIFQIVIYRQQRVLFLITVVAGRYSLRPSNHVKEGEPSQVQWRELHTLQEVGGLVGKSD